MHFDFCAGCPVGSLQVLEKWHQHLQQEFAWILSPLRKFQLATLTEQKTCQERPSPNVIAKLLQ